MNVYIEIFHICDLFSENERLCKPLSPLHVSGVLDELFFQHEKNKKNFWKWIVFEHSTVFDTFIMEEMNQPVLFNLLYARSAHVGK